MCALFVFIPGSSFAQVYKCTNQGKIVYSDVRCKEESPPLRIFPSGVGDLNPEQKFGANRSASTRIVDIRDLPAYAALNPLLERMRQEKDRDKLVSLYVEFKSAHAVQRAKLMRDAQDHANAQLQIPQLEKTYIAEQARDRAASNYYSGRGDSLSTLAVWNQLLEARKQADAEILRFISQSPTGHYLKSVDESAALFRPAIR